MRAGWRVDALASARNAAQRFFSNRELAVVVCFCVAGLTASIVLALSFPLSDETAGILAQIL
jgi:hypothetical protein